MDFKKLFILGFALVFTTKLFAQKPNIIIIMTDDQGWYDVGFNGNTIVKTPNLDLLASEGIILDRFYSGGPVCSPTRASLLTGRNPVRMGISDANTGHLLTEEITLPEILKEYGYATAHFGKWHLGTFTQTELDANRGGKPEFAEHYSIPTMHGHDEFFATESKVPTFDPMFFPDSFAKEESKRFGWKAIKKNKKIPYGTAYWKTNGEKETKNLEGSNSKIIIDRVLPFIEKSKEKNEPFFTTIWLHTPHLPVVADSVHRSQYNKLSLQEQLYYGSISAMDEQIGRLWSQLKAMKLDENTLIWFCSDNGPEVKTPGSAFKFRGKKRDLYEGGLRVPAFIMYKNKLEKGKRLHFPSVTSDILPTVLDVLNINYPYNRPIDGESILPLLKNRKSERKNPIGFIYRNNEKVSWVTNQYKIISNDNGKNFEMYDLLVDKSETKNIAAKDSDTFSQLKKELEQWLVSVKNSKNGADYKRDYIHIQKENKPKKDWKVIWQDNFTDKKLDTTKWSKIPPNNADWGNYMTDDPRCYDFKDGKLYLKGIKNTDTIKDPRPYLTGGIYTKGKFAYQYGKIEIHAKLESAQGAWPAMWMLSETNKNGKYPRNGEIDIMEHLNFEDQIYQTTHSYYTLELKQKDNPPYYTTTKVDVSKFNTYGMEWYPDKLVYTLNGKPTITYPKLDSVDKSQWPFDQPFYLLIDQQLGGSWVGKVNPDDLPVNMIVDWVKVYQ
ncbi:sulfatase-like hydrolase/transferase [Aureibaculum conchae]|uniref:sulfatase-like hydrolase/transferase n=1 Tax=Aureibaculum sp. 2308TA14-22 TaxID=3108392 RepID=UPI003390A16C